MLSEQQFGKAAHGWREPGAVSAWTPSLGTLTGVEQVSHEGHEVTTWHGKHGHMGLVEEQRSGYGGGLERKRRLLDFERSVSGGRP